MPVAALVPRPFSLFIGVVAWALLTSGSTIAEQRRPNVLMIVVDDMNDWIGCLGGHLDVQTPNMDRLAARGMLFANAHCAAPVCNPSRVATLTGLRPGRTGIYDNSVVWHEAVPDLVTIPQHFKAHGYQVTGGGKVNHHMPRYNRRSDWHFYFDQIFDSHYQDQLARCQDTSHYQWPAGFPLNQLASVRSLSKPPKNPFEFDWGAWDKQDAEMGDGRMIEWAATFLEQTHARPFFLAAGIYRPHLPFYAPRKYFDMYPVADIVLPELKPDDLDDLPAAGRRMALDRSEDYQLVVREGKYRELVQAYLASISYADALVGRLLDALQASSHADNTIVVLWSDHGWHLGEKQHLHKFTLWERSTRVPLIVTAPGITPTGAVCLRSVGMTDLFPTLNELCNLPTINELDGTSLVPLLRDPQRQWQRPALTSHGPGNHALRSDHWRYIRYADGSEELYDHLQDHHEWNNLADQPALVTVKSELMGWFPTDDAPNRRSGKGKTSPGE